MNLSLRDPLSGREPASGGPGRTGLAGTPPLYQRCQNDKDPAGAVENGGTFGVDWCTITGPECTLQAVSDRVETLLLGEVPRAVRNRRYADGRQWPCGLSLTTGYLDTGRWRLDVPGNACRVLGLGKLHRLAHVAMFGGTCTRLDLMRDIEGEGLTLVEDVIRACRAGSLRMARSFKEFDECDADAVTKQGHGVYLGSSGSDRFMRVYDKGIEQGATVRGLWHRAELQMRGALANAAAVTVFGSPQVDVQAIAGLVCGAVDFRTGPRGDGVQWRRFPRCEFWGKFVAGFEASRCRLEGVPPNVDRWQSWFRTAAGGVLVEAANQAGVDLGRAVALLLSGIESNEGTKRNPVVGYLADFFALHLRA